MKANRKTKELTNDQAEMGVGTLIVFIAMVLVAAVAAAVLINTSGLLQERATKTGKQATSEVSSNLKVVSVYGKRANANSNISSLEFYVELAAGAPPLDVSKLIIRYDDGDSSGVKEYTKDGPDTWQAQWIRDVTGSGGTSKVMSPGDLVKFSFTAPTAIKPRSSVHVLFLPEVGAPVPADFVTPPTYGQDTVIQLR